MTDGRLRWLSGRVGGWVLALVVVGAGFSRASVTPVAASQAADVKGLRVLDAARARWRAHTIAHYRLRVETMNLLSGTVTESDVRNGTVLVAREADRMPDVGATPDSGKWRPSDGQTVETLFALIEHDLHRSDRVVSASYDPRRGYPTWIYTQPSTPMFDGIVSFSITLTASPPVPLAPMSLGEAYRARVPVRLVDRARCVRRTDVAAASATPPAVPSSKPL